MKHSPARVALILLFVFIGCFGTAFAAAGMLTALPAPAVGGTCGPSTASETALEALAKPGSIGAGPRPPTSNAAAYHQWSTFVQQCQDLADRRGLASLAIFVLSIAVAAVGLLWVLRKPRGDDGRGDTVEGTTDWLVPPGVDDPSRLVGAGAVIAPPAAYGSGQYPVQQQAWPAQPVAPYPYPAAPPAYPQAAAPAAFPAPAPAYPQAPLPPPPAYTQAPPPVDPAPVPPVQPQSGQTRSESEQGPTGQSGAIELPPVDGDSASGA